MEKVQWKRGPGGGKKYSEKGGEEAKARRNRQCRLLRRVASQTARSIEGGVSDWEEEKSTGLLNRKKSTRTDTIATEGKIQMRSLDLTSQQDSIGRFCGFQRKRVCAKRSEKGPDKGSIIICFEKRSNS